MNYILLSTIAFSLFFNIFSMDNSSTQSLKKPLIIKKDTIELQKTYNNTENGVQAIYSPNGTFFIENVSTKENVPQINLWDSLNLKTVKSFDEYSNRPVFAPYSNYLVFFSKTRFGENYPIASLYSIIHKKKIPLYDDKTINTVFRNLKLALSANGEYIMYHFLRDMQYTDIKQLLKYNDREGTINEISLNNWNIGDHWQFCSDNANQDAPQHIIYLSPDNRRIIKRNIDNQTIDLEYCLTSKCSKIKINESLVTLKYDDTIELLTIKNNSINPLQTIPYSLSQIKILPIKEKKIIIHQSGQASFIALNGNYQEIYSYTFKNTESSKPIIKKMIANEAGTHFLVLYSYNEQRSPSSMVLFRISPDGTIESTIVKDFKDKIVSIQFLHDNLLLIQGIKARIFDLMGNKIQNLGNSQSTTAYKNSVLQIKHTPSIVYDSAAGGFYSVPMKTKVLLSTLK